MTIGPHPISFHAGVSCFDINVTAVSGLPHGLVQQMNRALISFEILPGWARPAGMKNARGRLIRAQFSAKLSPAITGSATSAPAKSGIYRFWLTRTEASLEISYSTIFGNIPCHIWFLTDPLLHLSRKAPPCGAIYNSPPLISFLLGPCLHQTAQVLLWRIDQNPVSGEHPHLRRYPGASASLGRISFRSFWTFLQHTAHEYRDVSDRPFPIFISTVTCAFPSSSNPWIYSTDPASRQFPDNPGASTTEGKIVLRFCISCPSWLLVSARFPFLLVSCMLLFWIHGFWTPCAISGLCWWLRHQRGFLLQSHFSTTSSATAKYLSGFYLFCFIRVPFLCCRIPRRLLDPWITLASSKILSAIRSEELSGCPSICSSRCINHLSFSPFR